MPAVKYRDFGIGVDFSILDGVPSQDIVGAYRMHKGQMINEFIPNPQYKEYKGVDQVSDLH